MLSSFDILFITSIIVAIAVYCYAAYVAFGIRHTFSVGLYRNQALGVGLVASILAFNFLSNLVFSYVSPNTPAGQYNPGPFGPPVFFIGFAVIFYWIDSSVLAARKSDPLLRDIFYWGRARVILRPVVFLSAGFLVALFFGGEIITAIATGTFPLAGPGGQAPAFLAPFFFILLTGVPVSGVVLLPTAARRTKDPKLRKQLYWFGLFAFSYLLSLWFSGFTSNPVERWLVIVAFLILAGYCLYCSAKSLVPLYSFSQDVPQQKQA